MRSLSLAILLASISSTAFAAGTQGGHPDSNKPVFNRSVAKAWNYVVDRQDGAAFSGASKSPTGETGAFVGVFALDGTHFVTSTLRGSHAGEVMGDQLEICWTDNVANYVGVSCAVYKRQ